MQKSLLLICVLGLSCVSRGAQTNRASWDNLSGLQAGQKIRIVDMNSKKHSGTFVSASSTALSYQDSAGEQTIQKEDIRSVQLMKNKHRLRNALIGGAVGAGVGAGIGAATSRARTLSFDASIVGTRAGLNFQPFLADRHFAYHRFPIRKCNVKWQVGVEFGDLPPRDRDLPCDRRADLQVLGVRLEDVTSQTISILERHLVSKENAAEGKK